MSKKKIEQIPSQIISKQSHKLNLRKTLLNTKFNWLIKYVIKQDQQTIDDENYLTTSIKIRPQARNYSKRIALKENREIVNKSNQNIHSNRKYQSKNKLEHKYSAIRNRLYTENVENISKCKKGRNTSLLLHSINPKQTFNFIQKDTRRLGHNLKSDLQIYKRRYRKQTAKVDDDQFKLTPWNLDEEGKQNICERF